MVRGCGGRELAGGGGVCSEEGPGVLTTVTGAGVRVPGRVGGGEGSAAMLSFRESSSTLDCTAARAPVVPVLVV